MPPRPTEALQKVKNISMDQPSFIYIFCYFLKNPQNIESYFTCEQDTGLWCILIFKIE